MKHLVLVLFFIMSVQAGASSKLFDAIEKNDLKSAKVLLSHGTDPEAENTSGSSPLEYAIEKSNSEAVKLLLEYGASAFDGEKCLVQKSDIISPEMAKILMLAGVDPKEIRGIFDPGPFASKEVADILNKVLNAPNQVIKKAEDKCLKSNLNLLEKIYYNMHKSKFESTERCIVAEISKQVLK